MRKRISYPTQAKLLAECNRTCPSCGETDVSTFEFHHIEPVAKGGGNTLANLICLCANCHAKVTRGEIDPGKIKELKNMIKTGQHPYSENAGTNNIIRVNFGNQSSENVIANNIQNVNVTAKKQNIKIAPPEGSIASSVHHKNYTKYLINRYHEFKKIDVGAGNMRYPIFYREINKKFGADWGMISLEKFENLSHYIKNRIDKTKFGRIQKSRGHCNYSEFDDFCQKG